MRIVSLLPSATEIVCSLGLADQLVGVSHECDFPPGVQRLPKVTQAFIPHDSTSREIDALVRERMKTDRALYTLDMSVLNSIAPDLIVTQALCDVCAVAESEVREAVGSLPGSPRVVNLEPTSLDEVFACIGLVGEATANESRATEVIRRLRSRVNEVAQRTGQIGHRPRVMLLEWIDPPFSAGHWNPELIRLAGGIEVIGTTGSRSTAIPWNEIVAADPDVMVVACCGFDIERTRLDLPVLRSNPGWKTLSCVRNRQVYMVDGSAYFSRPGPRLVDSLEILASATHPLVGAQHPQLHRIESE